MVDLSSLDIIVPALEGPTALGVGTCDGVVLSGSWIKAQGDSVPSRRVLRPTREKFRSWAAGGAAMSTITRVNRLAARPTTARLRGTETYEWNSIV